MKYAEVDLLVPTLPFLCTEVHAIHSFISFSLVLILYIILPSVADP